MVAFKIDNNVPVPEDSGRGRKSKYPWKDMQVGDSILIPKKSRSSACTTYDYYSRTKKNNEAKFTSRIEKGQPDMVRIWRIK